MTPEQVNFVRLHHHMVRSWQSVLGGGMVQAKTDKGRKATIASHELADLIDQGFINKNPWGTYTLTETGKAI